MATVLEAEAQLTTQNQLTIPASFRKIMKLRGGVSRVKFEYAKGDFVILRAIHHRKAVEKDETLQPFLKLLAQDMVKNPRRILPFPSKMHTRAKNAVDGVDVDLDGPLTGED